jgi:hypothetical protein
MRQSSRLDEHVIARVSGEQSPRATSFRDFRCCGCQSAAAAVNNQKSNIPMKVGGGPCMFWRPVGNVVAVEFQKAERQDWRAPCRVLTVFPFEFGS